MSSNKRKRLPPRRIPRSTPADDEHLDIIDIDIDEICDKQEEDVKLTTISGSSPPPYFDIGVYLSIYRCASDIRYTRHDKNMPNMCRCSIESCDSAASSLSGCCWDGDVCVGHVSLYIRKGRYRDDGIDRVKNMLSPDEINSVLRNLRAMISHGDVVVTVNTHSTEPGDEPVPSTALLWLPKISTASYKRLLEALSPWSECDNMSTPFDPVELYDKCHLDDVPRCSDSDIPGLSEMVTTGTVQGLDANLRPYQRLASSWMLWRESVSTTRRDLCICCHGNGYYDTYMDQPFVLESMTDDDDDVLYCDRYTGNVSTIPPKIEPRQCPVCTTTGGILADEMGLGKTMELLTLILMHRRHQAEPVLSSWYTQQMNDRQERRNALILRHKINKQKEMAVARQAGTVVRFPAEWISTYLDRKISNVPEYSVPEDDLDVMDCICGNNSAVYSGGSVQCDTCRVWYHCSCVGVFISDNNTDEPFVCQRCQPELPSNGTVVVCPSSIIMQWYYEITRYVSSPHMVLLYGGVPSAVGVASADDYARTTGHRAHGRDDVISNLLSPRHLSRYELSQYDIVLTTYDIIQRELNWTRACIKKTRFSKKYIPPPSPLVQVQWWRCIVDETQIVESRTSQAAALLMLLPAKFRWFVSGTPVRDVTNGARDLGELAIFLNIPSICSRSGWNTNVENACNSSAHVLSQSGDVIVSPPSLSARAASAFYGLFWRRSKAEVHDQLGIPAQSMLMNVLEFSEIESYFYARQNEACVHDLSSALHRLSNVIDTLPLSQYTGPDMKRLLGSIVKLRQACCHPQVVMDINVGHVVGTPMTMNDLHDHLISRAKIECEDTQRTVFFTLHGLAGLYHVLGDDDTAITYYRQVLRMSKKMKNELNVGTDTLQLLHACSHLAGLLEQRASSPSPSCDEIASVEFVEELNNLNSRVIELKAKYSNEVRGDVLVALSSLSDAMAACDDGALYNNTIGLSHIDSHSKYSVVLFDAKQPEMTVEPCTCSKSETFDNKSLGSRSIWWLDMINMANSSGSFDRAIDRFRDVLEHSRAKHLRTKTYMRLGEYAFSSSSAFSFAVFERFDQLMTLRASVNKCLRSLCHTPTSSDILGVIGCSKCQNASSDTVCAFCQALEIYQKYWDCLFSYSGPPSGSSGSSRTRSDDVEVQEQVNKSMELNPVPNGDCELERLFKSLFGMLSLDDETKTRCSNGMKVFEILRKEYSRSSDLYAALYARVLKMDELNMACTWMRERKEGETVSKLEENVVISRHQAPDLRSKFIHDLPGYESLYVRAVGQMRYLLSLKNANLDEPCPICRDSQLKSCDVCVFPCGHRMCSRCTWSMCAHKKMPHLVEFEKMSRISGDLSTIFFTTRTRNHYLLCPTCRERCALEDINYIVYRNGNDDGDAAQPPMISDVNENMILDVVGSDPRIMNSDPKYPRVPIKGSYGSKIEGVVGDILGVLENEVDAKCIIFSQWNVMLDIVGKALADNGVYGVLKCYNKKDFIKTLPLFKSVDKRVLLLPVTSGANGLTLIEANHVFLIEPHSNPHVVAQMISRVHRLGQKRATTVHLYVVKNTVEEGVYRLSSRSEDGVVAGIAQLGSVSDKNELTLADIKKLFQLN